MTLPVPWHTFLNCLQIFSVCQNGGWGKTSQTLQQNKPHNYTECTCYRRCIEKLKCQFLKTIKTKQKQWQKNATLSFGDYNKKKQSVRALETPPLSPSLRSARFRTVLSQHWQVSIICLRTLDSRRWLRHSCRSDSRPVGNTKQQQNQATTLVRAPQLCTQDLTPLGEVILISQQPSRGLPRGFSLGLRLLTAAD